ncbi:MAG: 50S ribosomal protein L9 [Patescibacteria group bacterium]
MQVILLKNLNKVGKKDEIKTVADGFAMNFLIPQKIAIMATKQSINDLKNDKSKKEKSKNTEIEELNKLINKISNKKITVKKQASEKGKLFAAITLQEILAVLKDNFKVDLSKYKIKINKPVKEIGEHKIELKIGTINVPIIFLVSSEQIKNNL